ncbi:hypothetical protein JCM19376_02840 [Fusibacter bizertensis]
MDQCNEKKKISNQNGNVSLMLVIILPVIIIGCVFAYALLRQIENENQMQKLAYASSEAYLSRYNEYLFSQFGILANSDELSLEDAISYYAVKNNLISDTNKIEITNKRESLTNSDRFVNAINSAATVVISQSVIQAGLEIFEQNEHLIKLKTMYNALNQAEKSIEKYFEQGVIEEIILSLKSSGSTVELSMYEEQIKQYLQSQRSGFETEMILLKTTMSQLGMGEHDSTISEMFISHKEEEYKTLENDLSKQYAEIEKIISLSSQIRKEIEALEGEETIFKSEIEAIQRKIGLLEHLEKPTETEQVALEELKKSEDDLNDKIENIKIMTQGLYEELKSKINIEKKEISKSLYHKIMDAFYTIEKQLSGVDLGTQVLEIPKDYDHSEDSFSIQNNQLTQKILVSEYLMTVFKSYDQNCPRKVEYRNRFQVDRAVKGEIEYIITGEVEERKSLSQVKLKIVALRLPSNLMSLLQSSDKIKQLSQITIALPQPWRTLAFGSGILLWATAESYVDANKLLKGDGIALIKKTNDWQMDLNGILAADINVSSHSKSEKDDESQLKSGSDLYYQDYLRLLLYTQTLEKIVKRTMNLIEVELTTNSEGQYSLQKFSNAHVLKIQWHDAELLFNQSHQIEFYNAIEH